MWWPRSRKRRGRCCALWGPWPLAARGAQHRGEAGEVGGLDLAGDLEAEALVERRVVRVGAFEVGESAFGCDQGRQAVVEQPPDPAAALAGGIDADHRQLPVRRLRMVLVDAFADLGG